MATEIREQLTVRVARDTKIWLEQLTAGTRFSVSQVSAALLEWANVRGWRVISAPNGDLLVITPSAGSESGLDELSSALIAIESWMREQPARRADDMADMIDQAWQIVEDLNDKAAETSRPGTDTPPPPGPGPTTNRPEG